MSSLLARLGRACYRRRGLVSVVWLADPGRRRRPAGHRRRLVRRPLHHPRLGVAGGARPPRRGLAPAAGGVSAQIVFVAPEGATVADPAVAGAIQQVVAAAAESPQVEGVVSPFDSQAITPDGRAALATVSFDVPREELEAGDPRRAAGDHRGRRGRRPRGRRRRQRLRHDRRADRRDRVRRRRRRRPGAGADLRLAARGRHEPADGARRHRRRHGRPAAGVERRSRSPRARRRSR